MSAFVRSASARDAAAARHHVEHAAVPAGQHEVYRRERGGLRFHARDMHALVHVYLVAQKIALARHVVQRHAGRTLVGQLFEQRRLRLVKFFYLIKFVALYFQDVAKQPVWFGRVVYARRGVFGGEHGAGVLHGHLVKIHGGNGRVGVHFEYLLERGDGGLRHAVFGDLGRERLERETGALNIMKNALSGARDELEHLVAHARDERQTEQSHAHAYDVVQYLTGTLPATDCMYSPVSPNSASTHVTSMTMNTLMSTV